METAKPASDDEEFAPRRVANYRSIIDSDSEDEAPPQSVVAAKADDDSEENNKPSGSSSSEDEQPAPAVDRRKNANPKKNFLPVKTQRVSLTCRSKKLDSIFVFLEICNQSYGDHQRKDVTQAAGRA